MGVTVMLNLMLTMMLCVVVRKMIVMLITMIYVYCCEVGYGVDYVAKMFYEVEFQDAR